MGPNTGVIVRHGGDIDRAAALTGRPIEAWLDLSTGINPAPFPASPIPARAFSALPTLAETNRLLDAARAAYAVPPGAAIAAAPGTQAIIQWLPHLVRPHRRVIVLGPTYGEHARAWSIAGHTVRTVGWADARIGRGSGSRFADAGILVIGNPNNPDGHVTAPDAIADLAQQAAGAGGFVVVDEAFADTAPLVSVVPLLGTAPSGIVVLRSFGKFFGLAGIRLGFAIGSAGIIRGIEDALGPWAVSGPAIAIGTEGLEAAAWQEMTRRRLAAASDRLDGILTAAGLTVVGGTTLFRLARHQAACRVGEHLANAGIWVRTFDGETDLMRFGLPGTDDDFDRLAAALADARVR